MKLNLFAELGGCAIISPGLTFPILSEEPVQVMIVGAVYDRAVFPRINEIRAVTDRAYKRLAIT